MTEVSEETLSDYLSENDYRHETIKDRLDTHDERITRNERFRLMATGALTVLSFALGSGFVVLLLTTML